MKHFGRVLALSAGGGAMFISCRSAEVGEPIPLALSALLALIAVGLIAFAEREYRRETSR